MGNGPTQTRQCVAFDEADFVGVDDHESQHRGSCKLGMKPTLLSDVTINRAMLAKLTTAQTT